MSRLPNLAQDVRVFPWLLATMRAPVSCLSFEECLFFNLNSCCAVNNSICTIVICTKNSEKTLEQCLSALRLETDCRKIIVDGNSTDRTLEIASLFDVEIVLGSGMGLTADRQIGIQLSNSPYTFFVDSDHVVPKGFLESMVKVLELGSYDLVQSKLTLGIPSGILSKGEQRYYQLVHNNSEEYIIPGIAPAIFKTSIFKTGQPLEIDDGKTKTIEDTNWAHKAIRLGYKIGVQGPCVMQIHEPGFNSYVRKFIWYGKGDAEFCRTHPLRTALKHLFHLSVRYPFLYPLRAIHNGAISAIPFLVLQGTTRFIVCLLYILFGRSFRA